MGQDAVVYAVPQEQDESESGLGKPLPVRLSRIERYENQPRRFFDPASIEDMAADLQENKQKTPVKVCKHSTKAGVFVLIGGERRWRGFHLIAERTKSDPIVLCWIDLVHDERHHFREAFLDNVQREDLVPTDEAAAYKRLYDESVAGSHSARIAEVAKLARKSVTHVENYLFMHKLPDEVKTLMDPLRAKDIRLSTTAAVDIARSTDNPALQLAIAKESIEAGLGLQETRALIGVKTGKSGYGISGRLRKPSDDYKSLKIFLGNASNRLHRLKAMDVRALYQTRDDEFEDRRRDADLIRGIISEFNRLLVDVSGEDQSVQK